MGRGKTVGQGPIVRDAGGCFEVLLETVLNDWRALLPETKKSEYRISNKESRIMKCSFDIHHSLFDILRFSFYYSGAT